MMRGLEIGPHPGRLPGARRRPGRARGLAALRPAAGGVRQADLAAPGDRQLPRRHGDQADRRAAAGAATPPPLRLGRARGHGGRDGEAVRLRDRDGDRAERRPHPRRLRLLHRVRRRALLPGRAADDRRRGHQRDPAQRHRAPAHQHALPDSARQCTGRPCGHPAGRHHRRLRWSRLWPRRSRPGSWPTSAPGSSRSNGRAAATSPAATTAPCSASPATSSGSTAARRASSLTSRTPADRALLDALDRRAPTCSCRTSRRARPTGSGWARPTCGRRDPRLIHCSISGYGPDGPYRAKKAYDLLVQCEAGLVMVDRHPGDAGQGRVLGRRHRRRDVRLQRHPDRAVRPGAHRPGRDAATSR